jgi:hypothetical protein
MMLGASWRRQGRAGIGGPGRLRLEAPRRQADSSELTHPQFNFADFFPNTCEIATVNGTVTGIPLYREVQLLY